MKITAAQKEQYAALTGLGINRKTAIGMLARQEAYRIRKSSIGVLPTAPNREPGEWTKKTDAENERQETESEDKDRKKEAKSNIRLKLKPQKDGGKKPLSPTTRIIERLDGTQWLYQTAANGKLTVRQLGKYHTPVYVEERTDEKQPAKEADTKQEGKKEMKKSKTAQRFEKLVSIARTAPEKLSVSTRQAVSAYLQRQGMPVIEPPAPPRRAWFRPQTLAEIATEREAKVASTPAQPFIPIAEHRRMTTAEITEYKLQQARAAEAARTEPAAIEDRSGTVNWLALQ